MEITNETLPWTADDESHWNAFLSTTSGQRLIPKLAESAPVLLDGGHANKTLVRNGELRGFQSAIRTLLDLSHTAPPISNVQTTTYPSLEDDSKWNDGQKLETN